MTIILVPQGAEYQSVCRGLNLRRDSQKPGFSVKEPSLNLDVFPETGFFELVNSAPLVFPIPVGVKPLTRYLEKWREMANISESKPRVLLMGLCGSLSSKYAVGDVVLSESCVYGESVLECDRPFTSQLFNYLKTQVSLVKGLTSDRVIYSASEKRQLATIYQAEIVDMEGFAALKLLSQAGFSVAMLRVVSDDIQHDIPNLNTAIDEEGNLKSLPLAWEMVKQPMAAFRLIKGSLLALNVLQKVAGDLRFFLPQMSTDKHR